MNGMLTIVKWSSFEGVDIGLSTPVPRLDLGDGRGRWLSVRDFALAVEEGDVLGCLAGVLTVIFGTAVALDLEGLIFGLMVGVFWIPVRLLAAYGSAVAGRVSSGRLGRRTGAAIREPEAEPLPP